MLGKNKGCAAIGKQSKILHQLLHLMSSVPGTDSHIPDQYKMFPKDEQRNENLSCPSYLMPLEERKEGYLWTGGPLSKIFSSNKLFSPVFNTCTRRFVGGCYLSRSPHGFSFSAESLTTVLVNLLHHRAGVSSSSCLTAWGLVLGALHCLRSH